jgi:hypothetical protein
MKAPVNPMVKKKKVVKSPPKRRLLPTNQLALLGYWSSPVQKVVRKWRNAIGEDWCQHYMPQCAYSVLLTTQRIDVLLVAEGHFDYVLGILAALHRLTLDNENPDKWLLELAGIGEGEWTPQCYGRSFGRLQKIIINRGGPKFSENCLAARAKRLHLT